MSKACLAWPLAIAMLAVGCPSTAAAQETIVRKDLEKGQCARLGKVRLCLDGDYFAKLYVAGRRVDFFAGGVVADLPGNAVPVELAVSGGDYRVKVQDISTFDMPFARFNEIQFRQIRGRFVVTGYVVKTTSGKCELGVDVLGQIDFISGQVEATVDGRVQFKGPNLPLKLRSPDLFKFRWDHLNRTYDLYGTMGRAEAKYCEEERLPDLSGTEA